MAPAVRTLGGHLVDAEGRVLLAQGVSLGGDSKLPASPDLPTHTSDLDAFYNHRQISFVGRPFALEDADEHLSRIAALGLRLVRLVVVWEALEHAGPGSYDDDYIEYVRALVELFPRYGLLCIIDHHQDVWSRLCGGSGAPGWTLELAGFDIRALHGCNAAFQQPEEPRHPGGVWPSGYQKLAGATMATLFWAGDDFAPMRKVRRGDHAGWRDVFGGSDPEEQIGIGTFLRQSLIAAFARLGRRLADMPHVVGFEPINEPHRGYLELHSFTEWNHATDLAIAHFPSALQSFALGAGFPQRVPYYVQSFPTPSRVKRYDLISPTAPAWSSNSAGCIWRQHGVWEWNNKSQQAVVLRNGYFRTKPGSDQPIDFYADYLRSFVCQFAAAMHAIRPDWIVVAGSVPNEYSPPWPKELQPPNLCSVYDLAALFYRSFGNISVNVQGISRGMNVLRALHFGNRSTKRLYALQINNLLRHARESTGAPTFFGEVGMPWDINGGFKSSPIDDHDPNSDVEWDERWQERGLDAIASAFEQLGLGFAWWCYAPSNTERHGDGWMGEDFSMVSREQAPRRDDALSYVRGLDAIQRAHVVALAGVPVRSSYDMYSLAFECRFANADASSPLVAALRSRTTDIFLPRRRYAGRKLMVEVSDGTWTHDEETQMLRWTHERLEPGFEHSLKLTVDGPPSRRRPRDFDPSDFLNYIGPPTITILVLLLAFAWSTR